MLPVETEHHSKMIFSKWLAASTVKGGNVPREEDARAFADAAVRMAQVFSNVAERQASPACTRETRKKSPSLKVLTFAQLVDKWQRDALRHWSAQDRIRAVNRFRHYLFPTLAGRPVNEIYTSELVAAIRAIEDAGYLPLAHLVLRQTIRVFRFAAASGYMERNPAIDVQGCLHRWKPRRRATILLPHRVGELLRAIDTYHSVTTSKYMLRLLPLLFVRPGELRNAEWSEIDFKNSQWRIPARRMKGRRPHIVPLSRQAKRILRQVHRLTGAGRFVFASSRTESGVISVHLCTTMLQSIGFGGEITMGGFRSMAATLLSEQGWASDAIERQLSHLDPRPVRRSYNFAEYLPMRRRMMQAWADYLDTLKANGQSKA